MRLRFLGVAGVVLLAALPLMAADKQPKFKFKGEKDAVMAVQNAYQANDWNGTLKAIDSMLENFPESEFKPRVLAMAVDAAQRTGDEAQVMTWAERVTESDPNDIASRVTLAETTVSHIRENDLDKADNLKKVSEWAHKALDLIKSGGTVPAGIPDDKIEDYKKELSARAWNSLGISSSLEKKYADEATDCKNAFDALPNSITAARLAKAYNDNKQYDDAIATADKAIAMPDASPQVKNFAQGQKDLATRLKGAH